MYPLLCEHKTKIFLLSMNRRIHRCIVFYFFSLILVCMDAIKACEWSMHIFTQCSSIPENKILWKQLVFSQRVTYAEVYKIFMLRPPVKYHHFFTTDIVAGLFCKGDDAFITNSLRCLVLLLTTSKTKKHDGDVPYFMKFVTVCYVCRTGNLTLLFILQIN